MASTHTFLINGDFNQVISPLDRGFAYGDGVFRTMLVRNGVPESWPQHYQKLVADCAVIGIVCPSAELLMSDIQQLFPITHAPIGTIEIAKIIISRGEGERGYAPPPITMPTRVVIKSAASIYAEKNYRAGVDLHLCITRLADQPKLAGIKHLNRLENVMARMEWRDESLFDGVMLDQEGNVIECTMSNLFARFGTKLITPDLNRCGVVGITRQRIMALAHTVDLEVSVATLSLECLLKADEVVICNSLYGAFQVHTLNQKIWPQLDLAKKVRAALAYA
jgi:4-amino-4-deoxychorismate lyase